MKVKTLINKLLNYDMDVNVELVIFGDNEERFTCTLNDNCVDELGGGESCPIILHSNELKDDDDESIQDLILYKHCLIDSMEKKKKKGSQDDQRR